MLKIPYNLVKPIIGFIDSALDEKQGTDEPITKYQLLSGTIKRAYYKINVKHWKDKVKPDVCVELSSENMELLLDIFESHLLIFANYLKYMLRDRNEDM